MGGAGLGSEKGSVDAWVVGKTPHFRGSTVYNASLALPPAEAKPGWNQKQEKPLLTLPDPEGPLPAPRSP